MIILFALIILFFLGRLISKKSYNYDMLGYIIQYISIMYLLFHIIAWSTAGYSYNIFVVKRHAFEKTLIEARKNNNPIELAAITQEVSKWNQDLAEAKYDNTVLLLKDYIDDRVVNLEPIK